MAANITPLYLDTSCAVRLFLNESQERGCERLALEIRRLGDVAFTSSSLLRIEWLSAMRAKQRADSALDYGPLLQSWSDFSERCVRYWPMTEAIVALACRLLATTQVSGRVRSLDCIHFSTFLEARKVVPGAILFSADTTMCALAQEYGVPFFNPLSP